MIILFLLIPFKAKSMVATKRQKCEVYSRIVGYLRPIEQWNNGKRQEYHDRKTFDNSLQNNYEK